MLNNLRGILGFSKREMNGVIICIPLMVFFIFLPSFYTKYFSPDYDSATDQAILDSLVNLIEEWNEVKPLEIEYFLFDPNGLSVDSLKLLGVPDFLAARIENYRSAGGRFNKAEDLQKIYGFPDSLFFQLEAFVQIQEAKVKVESVSMLDSKEPEEIFKRIEVESSKEALSINLNLADTTELKKLYGIGSVFARRIVKYRELLGGFHSIEQLREVYGVSDSLYLSISEKLIIRDSLLRRIPINLASFQEVNAHPYISYDQTKDIFNAKSKLGKFKSASDLLNLKSFDSAQVLRAIPYIDFR